jgi:hypothetical protein
MDEDSSVDSLDEALMYVTANRVGVFRRGKSKCKVVSTAGVDSMRSRGSLLHPVLVGAALSALGA